MNSPKRYVSGFTIIEIIAVLLLLSIIAATVMGRAISTENINLTSQMDKVRNHFRYAQSMAMKYGDAVWGFKVSLDEKKYWVFRLDPPIADPIGEANLPANHVMLPGENNLKVDMDGNNVNMTTIAIYFDRLGRPYLYYEDENDPDNIPITNPQTLFISTTDATPINRTFKVSRETGLIR